MNIRCNLQERIQQQKSYPTKWSQLHGSHNTNGFSQKIKFLGILFTMRSLLTISSNVFSWSTFLLGHKVKNYAMLSSLVIGTFSGLLWIIGQITLTDFLSSFIQLKWNQYLLLYNHFISWPFLCSNKSNLTFSFILLPWDSIEHR